MVHLRTLRMCAQKPLHEGGDALYAKDQSAAIRQRAEAEYLYAGRATSFSRYYESPRAEETLSSESQLVWAQMQDIVSTLAILLADDLHRLYRECFETIPVCIILKSVRDENIFPLL